MPKNRIWVGEGQGDHLDLFRRITRPENIEQASGLEETEVCLPHHVGIAVSRRRLG